MYKYKGGAFLVGVPARDLTEEEVQKLSKDLQEVVKKGNLYELVEEKRKNQKVQESEE